MVCVGYSSRLWFYYIRVVYGCLMILFIFIGLISNVLNVILVQVVVLIC